MKVILSSMLLMMISEEIYEKLTNGTQVEDYYLQGKLLYHLGKLCVPTSERVHVIREAHTYLV